MEPFVLPRHAASRADCSLIVLTSVVYEHSLALSCTCIVLTYTIAEASYVLHSN